MATSEFLEEFATIERYLLSKAGTFYAKQGFFNLLKNLQANKSVSNDLIILLRDVFQFRNKIVSSSAGISVPYEVAEKIQQIKQNLKI